MRIKPHPKHAACRALPETERYVRLATFLNKTPAKKRWDVLWKVIMVDSTGREMLGCYQPLYEAGQRYFSDKKIPAETFDLGWQMPRIDSLDVGYLRSLPTHAQRLGYVLPLLKTFTRDERQQAVKDLQQNYLDTGMTAPLLQAMYAKYKSLCPKPESQESA